MLRIDLVGLLKGLIDVPFAEVPVKNRVAKPGVAVAGVFGVDIEGFIDDVPGDDLAFEVFHHGLNVT